MKSAEVVPGKGIIKAWGTSLAPCFQKKPIQKGNRFTIQKYCRIKYTTCGNILVRSTYFGAYDPFSFLLRTSTLTKELALQVPFVQKQSAKQGKSDDVRSLYSFLKAGEKQWFEEQLKESNVNDTADQQDDSILDEPSDIEDIIEVAECE